MYSIATRAHLTELKLHFPTYNEPEPEQLKHADTLSRTPIDRRLGWFRVVVGERRAETTASEDHV